MYKIRVVNKTKQQAIIDTACVTYYAEDVMAKKVAYIGTLLPGLQKEWFTSTAYLVIDASIKANPVDNLIKLKTFLLEKTFYDISEDHLGKINKIVAIIDKNDDMNNYWVDSKVRNQVQNGLLIPKVTGHEVLYEMNTNVEVK